MKSYQQIQEVVDSIQDWIDENSRFDRYSNVIALNVKLYRLNFIEYSSFEDFLIKLDIAKEERDFLKSEINETWFTKEFETFIQDKALYFDEEFLSGCTIDTPEYYSLLEKKVLKNELTMHPAIDRKTLLKSKLQQIEKFKKENDQVRMYLNLIDKKNVYFFGRSGGWLSVCDYNSIYSLIEDVQYHVSLKEKVHAIEVLNELVTLYKAVKWLFDTSLQMFNNLPIEWGYELEYRLMEYLSINFRSKDIGLEWLLKEFVSQ